jgi:hypothetical protein
MFNAFSGPFEPFDKLAIANKLPVVAEEVDSGTPGVGEPMGLLLLLTYAA